MVPYWDLKKSVSDQDWGRKDQNLSSKKTLYSNIYSFVLFHRILQSHIEFFNQSTIPVFPYPRLLPNYSGKVWTRV